jgi:hypothetical protein
MGIGQRLLGETQGRVETHEFEAPRALACAEVARKKDLKLRIRRITMFHAFRNVVATFAVVLLCTAAFAQQAQFGTKAEAKAMEKRVIAELKANESAAIAKFNKPDGGFRDRDLYVYCFNTMTGIFTAQINPALMGRTIDC